MNINSSRITRFTCFLLLFTGMIFSSGCNRLLSSLMPVQNFEDNKASTLNVTLNYHPYYYYPDSQTLEGFEALSADKVNKYYGEGEVRMYVYDNEGNKIDHSIETDSDAFRFSAGDPPTDPFRTSIFIRKLGNAEFTVKSKKNSNISTTVLFNIKNRIYVDQNANGANDGSSWENAFNNLEDALSLPQGIHVEIWVAKGTYIPSKNSGFYVRPAISLYGGFTGNEEYLDERDPLKNLTIISGDVNGDDNGNEENLDDNNDCLIQFQRSNVNIYSKEPTPLDGFVFQGWKDMAIGVAVPYPEFYFHYIPYWISIQNNKFKSFRNPFDISMAFGERFIHSTSIKNNELGSLNRVISSRDEEYNEIKNNIYNIPEADQDGNTYTFNNYSINKVDPNGNTLSQWGTQGSENGEFLSDACQLAVDKYGMVYVLDPERGDIQKFNSDGEFLLKWQPPRNQDNLSLISIAADFEDKVYVGIHSDALAYGGRNGLPYLQVFDNTGNAITQFKFNKVDTNNYGRKHIIIDEIKIDDDGFVYVFSHEFAFVKDESFIHILKF